MLLRIHKDECIVEIIFIGRLTKTIAHAELLKLYEQLRLETVSGHRLLVDLTRAESHVSFAEMQSLVQFIRQNSLGFEKIGVLCETPLNYGTSRMFQSLYREKESRIKIDSSRETLISWMKNSLPH